MLLRRERPTSEKLRRAVRRISPAAHLALLLSAAYTIIASLALSAPGFHYDELQFANIATGSKYPTIFIFSRLWGIPAMLMPYYSALKSYLYYPIFSLFGVSAWTVRLPVILLTAVGLFLFWKVIRREFPAGWALGALALLAFDPSLISLTRLDVGPNAIELFCKMASLFFFYSLLHDRRERDLYLLLLFLAVGSVNKINFIWYLNAFTLSAALLYHRQVRDAFRGLPRRAVGVTVLTYLFCYGLIWYITKAFKLGGNVSTSALHDNLPVFWHALPGIISGQTMFRYLFGESYGIWSRGYLGVYGTILVVGLGIVLVRREKLPESAIRLYLFSWVALLATSVEILFTAQATAPWHYLAIYPFNALLLALSLYFISCAWQKNWRAPAAAAVLIIMVIFEGIIYSKFIVRYATPANWYWSPAISRLAEFTRHTNGHFISVDWGTLTPLIAYDDQPGKYSEIWDRLSYDFTPGFEQKLLHPSTHPTYFIAYNTARNPQSSGVKTGPYQLSNASFLKVLSDSHGTIKKVRDIRDSQGHLIYEVFVVSS